MKIPYQAEWTPELLHLADSECARVAESYGLETYPNQLEIITSDQMMDAYASVGMPNFYNHWSFGKNFVETQESYKRGDRGLAYEIVINSNPCIAYLMEENSLTMQTLVIAHASYGHNSFFKGNYLFKQWTDADNIVEYLIHAKKFIRECEDKYGVVTVETFLDAAHTLRNYAVDRYEHPEKLSEKEMNARIKERNDYAQSRFDAVLDNITPKKGESFTAPVIHNERSGFLEEPEENLLYFIEKNSATLMPWQREILKIIRRVAQYFYPQRQTQLMNEGWATFWHYTIMNQLYDEDVLNDGHLLEFFTSHTGVVTQQPFSQINPYALGFAMFSDIKRMCQNPTEEDKVWFPEIVNTNWVETLDFAMRNFKDESFISQYLSPKVMRDLGMINLLDDSDVDYYKVTDIQDDAGYKAIRAKLSASRNLSMAEPDISVIGYDALNNGTLQLKYKSIRDRTLDTISLRRVLQHINTLWGRGVGIAMHDRSDISTIYIGR